MPEDGWVYRWCARALSAKGGAGSAYWTAKVHAAAVSGCTGTGEDEHERMAELSDHGRVCLVYFQHTIGDHAGDIVVGLSIHAHLRCTAATAVLEGVGR